MAGPAAHAGTPAAEQAIFDLLFDLYRHKRHHATELPAVKPTVAEFLERPGALTWVVPEHDPDYPVFGLSEILDAEGPVPELEALAAVGDGAAQPVPVGPLAHPAAAGLARSATTTG